MKIMRIKFKNIIVVMFLGSFLLLTGCYNNVDIKKIQPTSDVLQEVNTSTDEPHEIKYIGNKKSKVALQL